MKLAFSGLSGKMGKAFLDRLPHYPQHKLSYGLALENENIQDIPVYSAFQSDLPPVDIWVDFSRPEFLLSMLTSCPPNLAIISGTTGFDQKQWKTLTSLANERFIFHANNFSIGILAMIKAIESVSPLLKDWQTSLVDIHHIHKQDAPSGTAKWIAETVKASGGSKEVDIQSFRQGEITGRHALTFASGRESFEIRHVAEDRQIFIDGVFSVLQWAEASGSHKKPGLYGMNDYFDNLATSKKL